MSCSHHQPSPTLSSHAVWCPWSCVCVCVCVCSCSVVSDSLWPLGLKPTRLLCPRDSSGKNTGVGCHAHLQVIFPTRGLNPDLLHCRRILFCLSHQGSPPLESWQTSNLGDFQYQQDLPFLRGVWVWSSNRCSCISKGSSHPGTLPLEITWFPGKTGVWPVPKPLVWVSAPATLTFQGFFQGS